jgi:hypothetical protein
VRAPQLVARAGRECQRLEKRKSRDLHAPPTRSSCTEPNVHRARRIAAPHQQGVAMSATLFYKDVVDLLDADHKLAQKMFLDY